MLECIGYPCLLAGCQIRLLLFNGYTFTSFFCLLRHFWSVYCYLLNQIWISVLSFLVWYIDGVNEIGFWCPVNHEGYISNVMMHDLWWLCQQCDDAWSLMVMSAMWWCIVVAQGYTPLHLAAIHGHEDVIELLVTVYSEYSQRLFLKYSCLLLLHDAGADIVMCSPQIFIKSIMDVCSMTVIFIKSIMDVCSMTVS